MQNRVYSCNKIHASEADRQTRSDPADGKEPSLRRQAFNDVTESIRTLVGSYVTGDTRFILASRVEMLETGVPCHRAAPVD